MGARGRANYEVLLSNHHHIIAAAEKGMYHFSTGGMKYVHTSVCLCVLR